MTRRGVKDTDMPDIGPVKEPSEEDKLAALKAVCHYATGKEEVLDLAKMLGLLDAAAELKKPKGAFVSLGHPGTCQDCRRTMGSRKDVSWNGPVFYGGRGRCDRCYATLRREERRAAQ